MQQIQSNIHANVSAPTPHPHNVETREPVDLAQLAERARSIEELRRLGRMWREHCIREYTRGSVKRG